MRLRNLFWHTEALITLLLFLFAHSSHAQDVVSFSITQQNGLPSNTVYSIFQSSDGFLWLATENGLARYNGIHFRLYENTRVRSRAVSGLFEDAQGRIWMHNFFGEILYVENDSLKKLDSWEKFYEDGFPIISYGNDTLIINTIKHAFIHSLKNQEWLSLDALFTVHADSLVFGHNAFDKNGQLWFCYGTNNESYLTQLDRNFKPIKIDNSNAVSQRIIFWQDKMYLFNRLKHTLIEVVGQTAHNVSSQFPVVQLTSNILNFGDSLLAFLGRDGLHLLNKENEWQHILPGKAISSMTADREGGLWLGTINEGIFYVPFLNTNLFPKTNTSLYTKLANSDNTLLAGGYDGTIRVLNEKGSIINKVKLPGNVEVQSLFVDTAENKLVVFTNKLYIYNLHDLTLVNSLNLTSTKKIIEIDEHYILATSFGVISVHKKSNNIETLFANQRTASIGYDASTSTVWIGAQKGLYALNMQTRQYALWTDSLANSPGISSILVQGNQVILGTFTDGIYFLQNEKLLNKITARDGLLSNRISAMVMHQGVLWVGTEKGVSAVDLQTHTHLFNLDYTKGLAASEIYDLIFFNDQLWVSHAEGLQQFVVIPGRNTQTCQIVNTSLKSYDRIINSSNEITLLPASNQLTIQFDVANNLRNRGNTRIRYRIKELDKDNWQETTLASPIANYLALPAGNFTLEAIALNEDNIPSGNMISISINVLAPFWKKMWFLATSILLILVLVTYITYWYFNKLHLQKQLELKNENQEQLLRIARLTSIRAQMNPHFIFNTLSSIQGKILNSQLAEANTSLQHFAQLLRKVLELSSQEMISLEEEVDVLHKYLAIEKDRFDGSLDYEINIDKAMRNEFIQIPSLLTQPFVENALRHGLMHKSGDKKLLIDFMLKDDLLLIQIDDNGIGRAAAEVINQSRKSSHSSFAMNASIKRINLLNTSRERKIEFKIIDKTNHLGLSGGTTVVISIPLNHEQ